MKTKEDSFINKMLSSIKDFEKYPEMATKPFSTVFKYLVKLIAIFTLIVAILSTYSTSKNIQSGIEYFDNIIPDLSFSDNILQINSDDIIKIESSDLFDLIIINTNDVSDEEIQEYTTDIEKYDSGVIILKDKLILNNGTGTVNYSYEKLSEAYNITEFDKQTIISYFSGTNLVMLDVGIFIMIYIYLFIAYLASTLLDALVLGIMGYVTAIILRLRLKFIAMIKIAIHSLTLPIILNLIYIILQTIFNFEIKYFEVMYITVAYIYIITAILMIKSDLLKRGEELKKIIEEQENVKKQLEEEKQKKEEQEEQKQDDKKRKNKDDEKKDKAKDDGLEEEPQGENA
jgi:hypothetical protein